MRIDYTSDKKSTTSNSTNVQAPTESACALPDLFLPTSFGSGEARLPTSTLKELIVNEFSTYSIDVKVDAAREMIRRLEKDYLK